MKSLAQMSGEKTRDAIAVIRLRICATESGKTIVGAEGRDDFTAATLKCSIIRLARPSAGSFLSRGLVFLRSGDASGGHRPAV
jgi:hypothetical protein